VLHDVFHSMDIRQILRRSTALRVIPYYIHHSSLKTLCYVSDIYTCAVRWSELVVLVGPPRPDRSRCRSQTKRDTLVLQVGGWT
jgi:hypothetical protein